MPDKILGLDIQKDTINAVVIKSGLKSSQILEHARVPIVKQEDDDGWTAAIAELRQKIDTSGSIQVASFPADEVSFRNLEIPFKDTKKIRQIIPFELEPTLICPIEEVVIDFHVIDKGESTKIIAAAVSIENMHNHWEHFVVNKFEPEIVAIEAVSPALCLINEDSSLNNFLFISMEPEKAIIVVIASKKIHLIRPVIISTPKTYGLKLCRAIDQTIMLFRENYISEYEPEKIIITGKASGPQVAQKMQEKLDIEVSCSDLIKSANIKIENKLTQGWDSSKMDRALALALLQGYGKKSFNLRQGPFAIKKRWAEFKGEIIKGIICLVLIGIAAGLNFFTDMYFLNKEARRLTNEVRQIFKETMPGEKITNPIDQMQEKIVELKKTFMVPGEKETTMPAIDSFNSISSFISKRIDVKLTRLEIDADEVQITGTTDGHNSVDEMKNALEKEKRFKEVVIASSKMDRNGKKVKFKIKAMFNEDKGKNEGNLL